MTQHSGVAWGRCPAPLQFYMPVDGATFFAVHEHLSPSPLRVGVEGHPSYEECPLRQMHANPLPSVGSDGTFLACPPGSLVVLRGLIGGVALASTDTTIGGVLHWFALGHKHHLMDVALAESYAWLGEVVAIQDGFEKEEVEAEAQGKVKEGQGEGRRRR